jgi:hypothetical protein
MAKAGLVPKSRLLSSNPRSINLPKNRLHGNVKAHAAAASLPGQRSEPFYNGDRNPTKTFGADLAVGKRGLNLLQAGVQGRSGELGAVALILTDKHGVV